MNLQKTKFKTFIGLGLLLLVSFGIGCSDKLNPDMAGERNRELRKALVLKEQGQPERALQVLSELLSDKPRLARAHLEIARLYHGDPADYASAIYHYKRYLELQPSAQKAEFVRRWIDEARIAIATHLADEEQSQILQKLKRLKKENELLRERLIAMRDGSLNSEMGATRESADREVADAPVRSNSPSPSGEESGALTAQETHPEVSERIYRVQKGDTLYRIAQKTYQNPAHWKLIYKANRSSMKNERDLRAGQTLTIPPLEQ